MITRKYVAALLALLTAPIFASAMPAPPDPLYTYTVLPNGFLGASINEAGQVVGTFNEAAAVWSQSAFVSLASIAPNSTGGAINNRGEIAGSWNRNLFVYADGTLRSLGRPQDSVGSVQPLGFNDAGQVTGSYIGEGYNRGFIYSSGRFQTIGTFSGIGNSAATGLNSQGTVVGWSTVGATDTPMHAFVVENGVLRDIGTLAGATSSSAQDINDRGQIVGISGGRPFLYADGHMIDIGDPRDVNSEASAINNTGLIVGVGDYANDSGIEPHGFLYANGRNLDLNTLLVDANGWNLEFGVDVNDAGQILAFGCQFQGPCGSLLLDPVSPVPAPSHAIMLGVGLLLAIGRSRRGLPGLPAWGR